MSFMKITAGDCEMIAGDFLDHYQAKGFGVKRPDRRLTLVVFLDERPYFEFARKFATKVPVYAAGFYSRPENWLVLYDFRNVPVNRARRRPKEMRGRWPTRRPTSCRSTRDCSTGKATCRCGRRGARLVQRDAAAPAVIASRDRSTDALLDDLAHIRARLDWITATELLTDDAASFGNDRGPARCWRMPRAGSWSTT